MGYPIAEMASRLGVSQHSLYKWINEQHTPADQRRDQLSQTE